jgi:hypothetical protein
MAEAGIRLQRGPARKGERGRAGARLFKPLRPVNESVNDTFKGQLDLEQHGGHTPGGVVARVLQRILALTAGRLGHHERTLRFRRGQGRLIPANPHLFGQKHFGEQTLHRDSRRLRPRPHACCGTPAGRGADVDTGAEGKKAVRPAANKDVRGSREIRSYPKGRACTRLNGWQQAAACWRARPPRARYRQRGTAGTC